jgi:hypothetical protein
MSVSTLISARGSTVSVYRPTAAENADGSPAKPSWSLVLSGTKMLFAPVSDQMRGRVYGAASDVRDEGYVAGQPDIRKGDGVVVTAGFRNATRWRVEETPTYDFNSDNKFVAAGLVLTAEVFP